MIKKKELDTQIEQINQNIGSFKNQIEFFEKKEKEIENKIKELATQDSKKFIKKIDFVKDLRQIILNTVINRKEEIKNEIVNYIKEYLDKLRKPIIC
ncbi:hypothetical protein SU69_08555 [Thermosipho melanesiensis]|uniref:Uncharacterized protein n=2 Tax=Thermosipho melanesiensis TaxID=46541 RepID=A6LNN0_THEM4|nr:hypothetical protein [Thermosipho melanesiensis]ABR31531.1 hypothetical protein Tmel_1689 [Thermosipho melanesiensis BI429]APT74945.1 hypothetical protein BW47_08930 [Thermosipho melanesiensis]OOC35276.1 hypothetical protein SU69_08555 [Thermosipho melanesiensis]OOC35495.1 hypothetical protein SU70_08565 [Thermosipho melanesiensis]OOC36531.1 hypothetical protein SU68_08620 [Thermosipho melanesiensis]